MRIGQGCGHEKLEIFVVLKRLLTDLHNISLALFDLLLKQDRLKRWVNLRADVLQENPFTKLDTHLNVAHQV